MNKEIKSLIKLFIVIFPIVILETSGVNYVTNKLSVTFNTPILAELLAIILSIIIIVLSTFEAWFIQMGQNKLSQALRRWIEK